MLIETTSQNFMDRPLVYDNLDHGLKVKNYMDPVHGYIDLN